MSDLWKSLLASLQSRRETLLKFIIVMAILSISGTEIVAALELRILLEILGATLFTAAFIAGARLALLELQTYLRGLLLPGNVATYAVGYGTWSLGSVVTCFVCLHVLWKLL